MMEINGLVLAGRFYRAVVAPRLGDRAHAAALLGDGSEILGYDDDVSTDHDFGPRVQLFLPAASGEAGVGPSIEAAIGEVDALLAGLPARFEGWPVAYPDHDRDGGDGGDGGAVRHQVEVTTAETFFTGRIGRDPARGPTLADWLLTPTQILASLTAGAVFHDPGRELARRREALRWYPDDVWRYTLAAGWLRVGQEEAFVGRTGASGDDLGSRILAARLARDLVRLAFLIERRWAPYGKWLGRAFADLPLAGRVAPHLAGALAASGWREREAALTRAGAVLAGATNELGLARPVDPAPRRYHTRDIRVVGAERFAGALTDAITDPEVRALLARLGHRRGGPVAALPGAIDQAVDSTDVLSHPDRCRAAAPALGLPPREPDS